MSAVVDVIKLDIAQRETWRYEGLVLRRSPESILVEARFNRDDILFHGIKLGRNDRFVEVYYTDRWYNIFEIHDRDDDHLKGWYCNVSRPAEISDSRVSYVDLALDLLVFPDGRHLVLDEDEFAVLPVDEAVREQAWAALSALKNIFTPPVTLRLNG